jgi:hypothetical protein
MASATAVVAVGTVAKASQRRRESAVCTSLDEAFASAAGSSEEALERERTLVDTGALALVVGRQSFASASATRMPLCDITISCIAVSTSLDEAFASAAGS